MKNIINILKYLNLGKLYSPLLGDIDMNKLSYKDNEISVFTNNGTAYFNELGQFKFGTMISVECLLYPSKDNKDWESVEFHEGDILTFHDNYLAYVYKDSKGDLHIMDTEGCDLISDFQHFDLKKSENMESDKIRFQNQLVAYAFGYVIVDYLINGNNINNFVIELDNNVLTLRDLNRVIIDQQLDTLFNDLQSGLISRSRL